MSVVLEHSLLLTAVLRFVSAPTIFGRWPSLSAHYSEPMLRIYLLSREKQTARGRSTQYTKNSDPISSTSELLLRQNSVTAHSHQS
jgi:hypothetical protein